MGKKSDRRGNEGGRHGGQRHVVETQCKQCGRPVLLVPEAKGPRYVTLERPPGKKPDPLDPRMHHCRAKDKPGGPPVMPGEEP
jgi:hypothetical protein